MRFIRSVLVLTVLKCVNSALIEGVFNLTEYYSMPAQYSGDDFIKCMIEGDDALWCANYSVIKPNSSNPVWQTIAKYSNDTKRYYRHDLVQSSVCINWCKKILEKLDNDTLDSLYEPEFKVEGIYKIDDTVFVNATLYKEKYDWYVNRCRNKFFMENYGLKAYSSIVYCYSAYEDMSPDALDWSFVIFLAIYVPILLFCTLYDVMLRNKKNIGKAVDSLEDYSLKVRCILAFSVVSNWYRLNTKPKTQEARDLRYIQGLRATTTFLVLVGHSYITFGFAPVTNTEFIEQQYHRLRDSFQVFGMNVVQTFFAISGFLMGVQFLEMSANRRFRFSYFWVGIIYRYIRLTPVYAVVILFDATWLYKSNFGPFWKTTTETERTFCRRNWWTNLLYINNYVNPEQMCLIQSWYLAADFQLFIVGLLIVFAMWRFPKQKVKILFACLIISYIIPAYVTYVRKYDGAFSLSPHDLKFAFHPISDSFINYYIPFHTNAGNYIAGLGMAMLYIKYKKNRIEINKYKSFVIAFYSIFPIGLLIFMSGYLFYAYEFEKPAIWIAVFASLYKNAWGIFGAILMFGLIGRVGGVLRAYFFLPIFQPLGRISYCIYLVHLIVFRELKGDYMAQPYGSNAEMFIMTCAGYFISIFLALGLCITLEFPFTALLKEVFRKTAKQAEETAEIKMNSSNNANHETDLNGIADSNSDIHNSKL